MPEAIKKEVVWTEGRIAAFLARATFANKHLVIVPNCSWPGSECDLLVVTPNLRIIDVEIKISRSDLKADAKKDKWYYNYDFKTDGPWKPGARGKQRQWPSRVWKHYYVMPREIWKDELFETISPMSGVLLMGEQPAPYNPYIQCLRHATPDRKADKLDAEDAIDIARLASLRMWSVLFPLTR